MADVSVFLEWYLVLQVPERTDAKKHSRTQQGGSPLTWQGKAGGPDDVCGLQGKSSPDLPLQTAASGTLLDMKLSQSRLKHARCHPEAFGIFLM